MVKVCPLSVVIVPVRAEPVFAVTENETVPFPVPLAPDVMVIQGTLLTAVHVQPAAEIILKLPFPPVAGIVALVEDKVYAQPDA